MERRDAARPIAHHSAPFSPRVKVLPLRNAPKQRFSCSQLIRNFPSLTPRAKTVPKRRNSSPAAPPFPRGPRQAAPPSSLSRNDAVGFVVGSSLASESPASGLPARAIIWFRTSRSDSISTASIRPRAGGAPTAPRTPFPCRPHAGPPPLARPLPSPRILTEAHFPAPPSHQKHYRAKRRQRSTVLSRIA